MKANFYLMSDDELDSSIATIKEWLLKFGGHERWNDMVSALNVACEARDSRKDNDPVLEDVLDVFVK